MQHRPLLLIIDDLKSNRMVIKKVLQNGYDFIEASDGLEAINLLKQFTPDIILIDAIMPNMDGFEAIAKIRRTTKYKRTPILMITSLSDVKIKVKALEYGVSDFLTKPFDKYELRARCKSYAEMVSLNKQFSDAKINPVSKFKNEISLLMELVPNDKIFLFSINDFQKIDEIYGYKNSKIIEKKFGDFLIDMTKNYIDNIELYHVSSAKFIIKINGEKEYSEKEIAKLSQEFYSNCLKVIIHVNDMDYTPVSTVIYVQNRVNIYEDAMSALSYARKNNIPYIYSSDDINGIKDIVYSNIEVLKKVKNAINTDKIVNYYQPIFDNEKYKITKYETLVRLKCTNGKVLSPFVFLDIAKDAQIYEKITKIVYKNAFDQFKFNNDEFSINISYTDMENKNIKNYLFQILKDNPHIANRVTFEILEDHNMKDFGLFNEFIKEVKKYEAKIAIDNFGTNYSNFQNIIDIEPDFIKIDGKIIKDIIADSKSYLLLESINTFAHNFNIKTIAEHVASKELFNEIKNVGVDFSQGYFIGKPLAQPIKEKFLVSS